MEISRGHTFLTAATTILEIL